MFHVMQGVHGGNWFQAVIWGVPCGLCVHTGL